MCWKLVEDVLATDVRPTARHVLMVLAHRANHLTGKCFPGLESLARDTGLSRRAIQNAIADLVKAKHVSRFYEDGKGVQYFIHPVASKQEGGAHGAPAGGISSATLVHLVHPPSESPAPKPEPTINEKSSDQVVDQAVREILSLLGWATSLGRLQHVHSKLNSWLSKGYELERDIIAGIAFAIQERPGRTNSLNRFDIPIEQHHKFRLGAARAKKRPNLGDNPRSIGAIVPSIVTEWIVS